MAKSDETKVKVPVERLVKGLFVSLDSGWNDHPFLFSRFKIKTDNDLAVLQQLGLKEITVILERSSVDIPDAPSADAPPAAVAPTDVVEDMRKGKNAQIEQARRYRDKRQGVSQRYQQQAQKARKVVTELKSQPANAIHNADEVITDLAASFVGERDMVTNLVNLGTGAHSAHNHAVNVTMLSLMLGSAESLSKDELQQLGIGALLHDVGKIEIPNSIIMKKTALTRAEEQIVERHPLLGRKFVERVRNPSEAALEIIERHHEFLDGTGYPQGLPATKLSKLVRIVAVANTYDNLCNPPDLANAVTPKTALATMYTKYKDKLDRAVVERFIRSLGVYPPGTVVRLSDESIGLVIAVDPKSLLKPEILLYNPDIPKEDALIVNLKEHDDLAIRDVLLPGDYPSRIFEYLGMEERMGCFIEQRPG